MRCESSASFFVMYKARACTHTRWCARYGPLLISYIYSFVETMILPADIQHYLMSDATRGIEHQIENPSLQVVPSDFFNIRDYLLLRLLQTNAQRPMAVRNITTKAIDRAKKTDDGGALIMVTIPSILF